MQELYLFLLKNRLEEERESHRKTRQELIKIQSSKN